MPCTQLGLVKAPRRDIMVSVDSQDRPQLTGVPVATCVRSVAWPTGQQDAAASRRDHGIKDLACSSKYTQREVILTALEQNKGEKSSTTATQMLYWPGDSNDWLSTNPTWIVLSSVRLESSSACARTEVAGTNSTPLPRRRFDPAPAPARCQIRKGDITHPSSVVLSVV